MSRRMIKAAPTGISSHKELWKKSQGAGGAEEENSSKTLVRHAGEGPKYELLKYELADYTDCLQIHLLVQKKNE